MRAFPHQEEQQMTLNELFKNTTYDDGVDDKLLIRAIREARSARFEFGETPKGR